MSSVDNRIVNMQFNNKDFQAGAADSSKALTDLEGTIEGMGSSGGLEDMGKSVDNVSTRFGALQVAGVAALATIASMATQTAVKLGTDLLGSVTSLLGASGFQRSIDLQQAAFQFRGLGLDVKEVMQNATDAVYGTSFALNEAAGVASQFAGGGIKAGQDMETALRGVAGVAAQTGRQYKEIGEIFAGVAATGKLSTMDLFQFQTRNLDVTGALADELGKTQDQIRSMVSSGQIDFKTFATAMDNAFGKNAAKANRTFTGALANMKTAVTRIGAGFFTETLKPVGDIFNELSLAVNRVRDALFGTKKVGEDVTGSFGKVVGSISESIVHFIKLVSWVARTKDIMEGLSNIFAPFSALLHALGDAWTQVFPDEKNDGRTHLKGLTEGFIAITKPLQWLADQIPKITPIFVALFEVLKVGWAIVGSLGQVLGDIVGKLSEVGSNIIEGLMQGLTGEEIQAEIIKLANNIVEWIKGALGIASPAAELVPVGEAIVQGIIQGIAATADFLLTAMATLGGAIIDGLKSLFGNLDSLDIAALFNAILTGAVLLAITKIVRTIGGFAKDMQGIKDTLLSPFKEMTSTLKTMQTQIKAQIILEIAIAVGILTASLIALSLANPKKLGIGLAFLTALFAELLGSVALLTKVIEPKELASAAAGMVLIATSMLILSAALEALSLIDPNKVGQALATMAIALVLMIGSVEALGEIGPAALAGAGGIFIVANAMIALAAAVAAFSLIDPDKVGTGLASMAVALVLVIGAVETLGAIGPAALAGAGGIFIVASAMVILAGAVTGFGKIDPDKIGQGLEAMGIALLLVVAAVAGLGAIGPAALAGAGAIFIVSASLVVLAKVIGTLGKMPIEQVRQGLIAMAIALGILLAAAAIAAIPVVAAGLIILGASILALGIGAALVGVGLLAAATAFAIFVGVFAAGVGVVATGIASLLLLLPQLALQLAVAFVTFIETIAELAPRLQIAFGKIISGMLETIIKAIPELKETANKLIGAFLSVVQKNAPKFAKTLRILVQAGLDTIVSMDKQFLNAGLDILNNFIQGIDDHLQKIINSGTQLIVHFITGIGDAALKIIKAAGNTLQTFLDGLDDWVQEHVHKFVQTGIDIGKHILEGIAEGLADATGLSRIWGAITDVVDVVTGKFEGPDAFDMHSPSKLAHWWGEMIVAGLANGIHDNISNAVGATVALANAAIAAGDKVVAKAQKESAKKQIAADRAVAKANVSDKLAKAAEKLAQQNPHNKALQEAAKTARDLADKQAKAAQAAQKKADAAAQKVSDKQAFRAADDQGKGDILTAQAQALSERAVKALAKANAEAIAARKLHGKQRTALLKQSKEDAATAKRLADNSKQATRDADKFYADAVQARVKAIRDQQKAEEKAAADQEEFDNASAAGKVSILQQRAEAAQKRSEAAQRQSEALVKQAKKLAKTDARRAQHLLDKAEKLAQQAEDASQEAKDDADQADQIKNDKGNAPILQPSMSALEDAASAIDRYTESLQQAEEAAQAGQEVIQFVQNNTSPESLSDSEIYRQTKNLLSVAEVKMGAP